MLIETNISPTNTIYFIWSQLIEMFFAGLFNSSMKIEEMYEVYLQKNNQEIGMIKFIYALDRLFIIGIISFNNSQIVFKNDN